MLQYFVDDHQFPYISHVGCLEDRDQFLIVAFYRCINTK